MIRSTHLSGSWQTQLRAEQRDKLRLLSVGVAFAAGDHKAAYNHARAICSARPHSIAAWNLFSKAVGQYASRFAVISTHACLMISPPAWAHFPPIIVSWCASSPRTPTRVLTHFMLATFIFATSNSLSAADVDGGPHSCHVRATAARAAAVLARLCALPRRRTDFAFYWRSLFASGDEPTCT